MANEVSLNKIEEIIIKNKPRRALEMGCGLKSTLIIRENLKKNNEGFSVSLEDNVEWYDELKKFDDKFGQVKMSKFGMIDGILKYDYQLSGIYDFIFIDGPGFSEEINLCLKDIFLDPKCCLSGAYVAGAQSCMLLDYVWDHIDFSSKILIDGRIASVYYYLQKYGNNIKVISLDKPFSQPRLGFLKKEYHKIDFPALSNCVLITRA